MRRRVASIGMGSYGFTAINAPKIRRSLPVTLRFITETQRLVYSDL
jgi:hypothetical protein